MTQCLDLSDNILNYIFLLVCDINQETHYGNDADTIDSFWSVALVCKRFLRVLLRYENIIPLGAIRAYSYEWKRYITSDKCPQYILFERKIDDIWRPRVEIDLQMKGYIRQMSRFELYCLHCRSSKYINRYILQKDFVKKHSQKKRRFKQVTVSTSSRLRRPTKFSIYARCYCEEKCGVYVKKYTDFLCNICSELLWLKKHKRLIKL